MSRYKKIIIVFSIAVLMVSFFAVSKALAKDIIFDPGTDNVGIGTASPFEKLTISGESTIGGYPTISLINTTIPREWHFWPINGGDLRFRDDTAGIDIMTFEGGTGSVGINNNDPVYRLDVNGTGRFTSPLIVATPTDSNHATTKSYVDSSVIGDTTCDGSTCNVTNTGTLDGFSATSASTPSTIAARNSSGDINARLFKSEYDNTNGSVNYIMTQIDTVSNNYIRPSTPAQVAADLHTSLDSYLITGVTAGNQLTGGGTSGTVTLNVSEGSGSGLDADYVDGLHAYRFLRSDASDTMDAGTNTTLAILSNDTGKSRIALHGDSQGTGQVYVGQSKSHGGGIEYNGDSSPATTGAGSDYITLFRNSAGDYQWTARNRYNSNNWEFRGSVAVATPTASNHATTKSYVDSAITSGDADTVDGLHAYRFLRSDASDTFTGKLTASASNRQSGIYGTYDSYKIDHIWSMGTAYDIAADGSNFGNLYGLAYKHTNNTTGGAMAGGHQMVWATNGHPDAALGDNGIWAEDDGVFGGDVTATAFYYNSDKRLKDNIVSLGSESLAVIDKLNPVSFTWKEDGVASQGFIAQEVEKIIPELVKTNSETDMKSIQYANLTAVLTAGIKTQAAEIKTQKEKINNLETELEILKIQVNSLKNN